MKSIKLSFAVIVALVAVGLTVATKANFTGKKVITACYTDITLQDISASTFQTPIPSSTSCSTAAGWVSSGIQYLAAKNSAGIATDCSLSSVVFCCVEFDLLADPNNPLYDDVPAIDLDGTGAKKYVVNAVRCRPQ